MIWSFFKKKVLSIDLGSLNIKIIEAFSKNGKVEITNFGFISVIELARYQELTNQSYILEENLGFILKNFLKDAKIYTKNVYLNINAPYIFPASFIIPNVPEKNLPQVVRYESQKQIPISIDEVETEFRYSPLELENKQKSWLIFLSAVSKSYLKKLENLASLLKLKFTGYSFEYFNFENYFSKTNGNFVVIDIGHSYSTFNLIKDGVAIYGNKLKLRGYDYLTSIINLTNYPEKDALNFIIKRGLLFSPEEKELAINAENFLKNVGSITENEIKKVENSFLLRINKIYWTGGICLLNGFKEKIMKILPNYQQEIFVTSDFVEGEKFKLLKERSTIFSQAAGVLIKKILK